MLDDKCPLDKNGWKMQYLAPRGNLGDPEARHGVLQKPAHHDTGCTGSNLENGHQTDREVHKDDKGIKGKELQTTSEKR